jgi:catechol 2,3-dioxygenase-like lactoylglutathione lyase family enzyme
MTTRPLDLTGEFFQLGYVTRDMDRAIALYRDRYGVGNFLRFDSRRMEPPGATGPFTEVALAYRGPVMIELIRPSPENPGIYQDALRADGGVNLHHLGYLVDEARFETLPADFRAAGVQVPAESVSLDGMGMGMSLHYVDTRGDNGLFSEFISLREGGRQFFDTVPRN